MTTAPKICFVLLVGVTCALGSTTVVPDTKEDKHISPKLPGKCPDFPAFTSFDVNKSAGDWYFVEIGCSGFNMTTADFGSCVSMSINATEDGGMSSVMKFVKDDKPMSCPGTTDTPIKGQPGKFTIFVSDKKPQNTTTVLTILDSDYTNYGTGVSCVSDGENHGLFANVISRTKVLDPKFLEKAEASFEAAKIIIEREAVDQSC